MGALVADWVLLGVAASLLLMGVALVLLLALLKRIRGQRLDPNQLTVSLHDSLQKTGISERLGEVREIAHQMSQSAQELQRVFTVQQQRGVLGELQLEEILADHVPPDRLFIRRNLPMLGTPDAALLVQDRYVCIDSKFPLDQYREMMSAPEADREARGRAFLKAVRGHLDTVGAKYVKPDGGSAPFALAFIPSEAVYTYIHQADPGLGREYAMKHVLLASPSTLTTHVALLVNGIRGEVLSARVQEVQNAINRLDRELNSVREAWDVLRKHVRNAGESATKVENALIVLDSAFRAARSLEHKGE